MVVIAAIGAGILFTTALLEIRHKRNKGVTALVGGAILALGAALVSVETASVLPLIALLGAVVCGSVTAFFGARPQTSRTA